MAVEHYRFPASAQGAKGSAVALLMAPLTFDFRMFGEMKMLRDVSRVRRGPKSLTDRVDVRTRSFSARSLQQLYFAEAFPPVALIAHPMTRQFCTERAPVFYSQGARHSAHAIAPALRDALRPSEARCSDTPSRSLASIGSSSWLQSTSLVHSVLALMQDGLPMGARATLAKEATPSGPDSRLRVLVRVGQRRTWLRAGIRW